MHRLKKIYRLAESNRFNKLVVRLIIFQLDSIKNIVNFSTMNSLIREVYTANLSELLWIHRVPFEIRAKIDSGPFINHPPVYKNYHSAIKAACRYGHTSALKQLLEFNGRINYNDVIRAASSYGDVNMVKLVISHFKLENVVLNWYTCKYAMDTAVNKGNIDMIKFFITFEVYEAEDFTMMLRNACSHGYIDIVEFLIDNTIVSTKELNHLLIDACYHAYIDLAKLLIAKGANNLNKALFKVCYYGEIDVVKFLLTLGVSNLDEALFTACRYGFTDISNLLIEHAKNFGVSNTNKCWYEKCPGHNFKTL